MPGTEAWKTRFDRAENGRGPALEEIGEGSESEED